MLLRGIFVGVWVFLSSVSWGAEICERLLKKDFRETSNIRLAYNDSGVVLEQNQPIINKKRFGSYAFTTPLEVGDRILAVDQKPVASDDSDAHLYLSNLLETSAMRDLTLTVQHQDGEEEIIDLKRIPYLGHPIVEANIILNDFEVTQQSSKSNLNLEVYLQWQNEDLIHNFFNLTDLDKSPIKCIYRKSAELENILQKIWYPTFETTQTGSFINDVNFKSLLITNDQSVPFNFILKQQINYQVTNSSDFRKFPFDDISTSADFIFQDIDLSVPPRYNPEITMSQGNDILYEWKINDHRLNCCDTQLYGQGVLQTLDYSFDLNRKSFYYVLKIILPVIFLVYLSFSVFYIRARELESKLAVSMGSLLTLVAYNFVFGDDVPKLNYITVLDAWILLSYLFAGLSTMITIWSYWDYHRDQQTGLYNTIDRTLRWFVPITYHLLMAILWWGITNNWNLLGTSIAV